MQRLCVTALAISFSSVLYAQAQDDNQKSVRANIENGGWQVGYGRMITEWEYVQLTAAIAEAIASKNPSPVLVYLENFAVTTVDRISARVPEISRTFLIHLVKKTIITRGGTLTQGRIDVKFGIATYQRWNRVVVDVPEVYMARVENWVGPIRVVHHEPRVRMRREESKIPLPNWHQPYVGIRLRY